MKVSIRRKSMIEDSKSYHADVVSIQQELGELDLGAIVVTETG